MLALYRTAVLAAAAGRAGARSVASAAGNAIGPLFDCDANLAEPALRKDAAVLLPHEHAGVTHAVIPASNLDDLVRARALAGDAELFARTGVRLLWTIGIHPYCATAAAFPEAQLREILAQARAGANPPVAWGECGLDFSEGFPDPAIQLDVFRRQLDLACEFQLPLFLHERDAHGPFVRELVARKDQLPRCLVHCFTGNAAELKTYVEFGCWISVSGVVARGDDFPEAARLRQALREQPVPSGKLLVETDAPYLSFPQCRRFCSVRPHKPSPNVPSALLGVCEALARVLGSDLHVVCNDAYRGSLDFFGVERHDISRRVFS